MFRGYLSFQGGYVIRKTQGEMTSTMKFIHLDLRLFDAWNQVHTHILPNGDFTGFTMLESQKSH